jgi:L-fuconolactonase
MKIDSHQHFWQYNKIRDAWISDEMSILRNDFMPSDLAPILQKNGINGCIAVQADQSESETKFLLDLADKNEFIKGVVGWIDLRATNLEERLDFFSKNKKLKGFRHILQGEKPAFMLQPDFMAGVMALGKRDFTYDLLVFPKHLTAVKQFLRKLEGQPFVLDHLAKPYLKRGLIQQWKKDMQSIAKHENVYCKISGMVTEADWKTWKPAGFEPYLEVVLEAFGSKRLMYGSDWPVCLLAADYEGQFEVVKDFISKLTTTEQSQIMGENAVKFYNVKKLI